MAPRPAALQCSFFINKSRASKVGGGARTKSEAEVEGRKKEEGALSGYLTRD